LTERSRKTNQKIKIMKAYKVFDENLKCRGFQYEVGKTYKMKEKPVLCEIGFHACIKVADCFNYYSFDPKNRIAEVELMGIVVGEETDKQCCNQIQIIKELTWNEMLVLANSGIGNTGRSNSGRSNSGDSNSGDYNSGHSNSGRSNSGDSNSGRSNSGDSNSGHSNSGDSNSGDSNSGDSNSGDSNSGDYNSGDYNSGHSNSGHFNSITPSEILVFNKPCNRILWDNSPKPNFIYSVILNRWISFSDMTDEEKIKYPKAFVCDGYLKSFGYKEAWANAFKSATENDIKLLKALPNFDADVFEEITGIMV
jgi:hypothetical protein